VSQARVGVLVVAHNAVSTLVNVLDRLPSSARDLIDVVLVSDDHSTDGTYEAALEYERTHDTFPIVVVQQRRSIGYGGNQKFGFRWLARHGVEILVLLHGNGPYAPEALPEMIAPLLAGDADAVIGSRMLVPGAARKGGMPLYKYLGNRVLTRFENRVSGLVLSEWHSGYRAFSVDALARIPFEENSDGFNFDTEVLLQLFDSGARIAEVPIPSYYGEEIRRVNGLEYARDVCRDVLRYRLVRIGLGSSHLARWGGAYELKNAPDASHRVVLGLIDELAIPPGRVLDLGCAGGQLSALLRERGHSVVGVEASPSPETAANVDRLVVADLDAGLPDDEALHGPFDTVLALDVLEHLRDPSRLLQQLHDVCAPDAVLISSVPNIGHWYPRLRIGVGRFNYDRRGILDATHMRFFTWRSFSTMVGRAGWQIDRRRLTGVPFELLGFDSTTAARRVGGKYLARVDRTGRRLWPSMFAYQYVATLRRDPAFSTLDDLPPTQAPGRIGLADSATRDRVP
jgi:2-polyprenyl-3-methyl-5-hydroxy-6-metoxy-1,4-benzoquinol methylase